MEKWMNTRDERVDWHEVELIIETHEDNGNVRSITSDVVCWKCQETWFASELVHFYRRCAKSANMDFHLAEDCGCLA